MSTDDERRAAIQDIIWRANGHVDEHGLRLDIDELRRVLGEAYDCGAGSLAAERERANALQARIDAVQAALETRDDRGMSGLELIADHELEWLAEELRAALVSEQPAPEPRPVATQYEVDRHAAKQDVPYSDAWRYFERLGYDMSGVWPQYG